MLYTNIFRLFLPFRIVVIKVEPFDFIGGTLIANVIKACKAGSFDITHAVIRHQKMLFPAHINKIVIKWIVCKVIVIEGMQERFKGRKFALFFNAEYPKSITTLKSLTYPMQSVNVLLCLPFSSQEWVLRPNNFAFKECLMHV